MKCLANFMDRGVADRSECVVAQALHPPRPRPWVLGSETAQTTEPILAVAWLMPFRYTEINETRGSLSSWFGFNVNSRGGVVGHDDFGSRITVLMEGPLYLQQENITFSKKGDPLDVRWHVSKSNSKAAYAQTCSNPHVYLDGFALTSTSLFPIGVGRYCLPLIHKMSHRARSQVLLLM